MDPSDRSSRVVGIWVLLLVVWAVTWAPTSALLEIHSPTTGTDTPFCSGLNKIHLDQHEVTIFTPFVQFLRFMADVPDLTGFTVDFWFNLDAIDKNATIFTYALEECRDHWPGFCILAVDAGACSCAEARANGWCQNKDSVINNCRKTCDICHKQGGAGGTSTLISLKYVFPSSWELTVMGHEVLVAGSPSIEAGTWHHLLLSWHREAPASLWMDGTLIYQYKHQKQMDSLVIPRGGEVKLGQTETAIAAGADQGEGLQGWITLFNFDSRAIQTPDDPSSKEKVSRLYSKCAATPLGHDIIEWVKTLHKGHGGITSQVAKEQCHHF